MKKIKKTILKITATTSTLGAAGLSAVLLINDFAQKVEDAIGPITQEWWFYPAVVGGIALLILIVLGCIIGVNKKIKKEKRRKEQLENERSRRYSIEHNQGPVPRPRPTPRPRPQQQMR